MDYSYELRQELFRLCGRLSHEKDPNKRWEIECEIENVRQQIAEEKGQ